MKCFDFQKRCRCCSLLALLEHVEALWVSWLVRLIVFYHRHDFVKDIAKRNKTRMVVGLLFLGMRTMVVLFT